MEWKTVKIGDIGKVVTGKTPRTSIAENYGGNIPFLTPSDDLALKFAPVTNKTLTEQGVREVKNCLIPANSVCVSCIGSDLGKVVMNREPLVTNQQINSILPHENVDAHFIYYAMIEIGKHLNHLSKTSTAVPIINKSTFCNTELPLPPLETQRRIAAILSSLDDKIENNNRSNRNLEEQAQALFKSWFVDFEPWGGTMPEDWKEGTLGEFLIESKEKVGNRVVEEYSVGKQGIRKRSEIYHKQITSTPASNKLLLKGQIAFGMGSGCVDWGVMTDEIGATSPAYTVYSISKIIPTDYFKRFFAIKHAKALDLVKPSVRQGQGLDKGVLLNKYIYIPTQDVWSNFERIYNPMIIQIANNQKESARLAALRDTLLPKLMKGEVIV